MRAAQKDDITGKAALTPENPPAKIEQFIERGAHRLAMTEIIAEINDLVALAKALANQIVQVNETLRLGMDGGYGPHPLGSSQASKNLRPPRPAHAALRPAGGRRGSNQAVSNCSTR
jgi:hypothetical protein